MHGLFLGTAKKMLEIWQSSEILKKSHFQRIQEIVDAMKVPSDVGRIPRKISSGFSGGVHCRPIQELGIDLLYPSPF